MNAPFDINDALYAFVAVGWIVIWAVIIPAGILDIRECGLPEDVDHERTPGDW